ncbi:MAG: hypothetical protein AAGF53_06290 [Pseudomonadota bacterium]
MTKKHDEKFDLNVFFDAARQAPLEPGADLLMKVQNQALEVQVQGAKKASEQPKRRFADFLEALGGWPSLAGLSTAAVAGVWIGVAPPDSLALTAQTLLQSDVDVLSDFTVGFGLFEEAS